jgi:hypothetical protein
MTPKPKPKPIASMSRLPQTAAQKAMADYLSNAMKSLPAAQQGDTFKGNNTVPSVSPSEALKRMTSMAATEAPPTPPRPAAPTPPPPRPTPMPTRSLGSGPTAPVNMGKLNQINSMVAGRPSPTPARPSSSPMSPMKKGGSVNSSASKRADGIATRGKTKCKMC